MNQVPWYHFWDMGSGVGGGMIVGILVSIPFIYLFLKIRSSRAPRD